MIDLHIHTSFSDGELSPTEVVNLARSKSLQAIAITDHYSVQGVSEAKIAGELLGIEVVSGIEVCVTAYDKKFDVLGLLFDESEINFTRMLKIYTSRRIKYILLVEDELRKKGLYPKQSIVDAGSLSISRLLHSYFNHFSGTDEEAIKCITNTKAFSYLSSLAIPFSEFCSVIHGAGGVVVIPHVSLLNLDSSALLEFLEKLKTDGLDGVEVKHPTYDGSFCKTIIKITKKLGLLKSGGSDFHGAKRIGYDLGSMNVEYEFLRELKKRQMMMKKIGEAK